MYCCCVFVTYPIKIHKSSPFFLHRSHRWLMALANRTHIECFIIWSFKMVCAPSFCLFTHLLIAFDIFFFSHHLPCALFNSTTTHTYEYTARIKMYFIFIAETIFYEWFTWKCERFRMIFHFTRAPYVCTWMFCVRQMFRTFHITRQLFIAIGVLFHRVWWYRILPILQYSLHIYMKAIKSVYSLTFDDLSVSVGDDSCKILRKNQSFFQIQNIILVKKNHSNLTSDWEQISKKKFLKKDICFWDKIA